jgi:hypothetical protein
METGVCKKVNESYICEFNKEDALRLTGYKDIPEGQGQLLKDVGLTGEPITFRVNEKWACELILKVSHVTSCPEFDV